VAHAMHEGSPDTARALARKWTRSIFAPRALPNPPEVAIGSGRSHRFVTGSRLFFPVVTTKFSTYRTTGQGGPFSHVWHVRVPVTCFDFTYGKILAVAGTTGQGQTRNTHACVVASKNDSNELRASLTGRRKASERTSGLML
jgi:ABC-type Fe3+-siderophore transport system permease subunit